MTIPTMTDGDLGFALRDAIRGAVLLRDEALAAIRAAEPGWLETAEGRVEVRLAGEQGRWIQSTARRLGLAPDELIALASEGRDDLRWAAYDPDADGDSFDVTPMFERTFRLTAGEGSTK